jgi:2-dehydropantoate 2-reductase
MHVCVVGAGALGRVYGTLLAREARADVSFVARAAARETIRIERVGGPVHVIEGAVLGTAIPAHTDVVLVCVRMEQTVVENAGSGLGRTLRGSSAPLVFLTPLLPRTYARLRGALGDRVVAAMPSVLSYRHASGTTRYWVPRVATTLIDERANRPAGVRAGLGELVRELGTAGIAARLELGVDEVNPATTATFLPLLMGLDAAGSIPALVADSALVRLSLDAAKDGAELARRLGKPAPWASMLQRFMGERMLRMVVALARRQSPEALVYVEEHFGRKLRAQNLAMGEELLGLADEFGTPRRALGELVARLQQPAGTGARPA